MPARPGFGFGAAWRALSPACVVAVCPDSLFAVARRPDSNLKNAAERAADAMVLPDLASGLILAPDILFFVGITGLPVFVFTPPITILG